MVNITRTLVISSKDQIYKLIESRDDLSSNKLFIPFMDSMYNHYYGCRCNADYFNNESDKHFNNLDNSEIIDFLKEYFNCNVIFQK